MMCVGTTDRRLVGRCAALALAAEIARRADRRREHGDVPEQSLSGFLDEQTEHLAAASVAERRRALDALRSDSAGTDDEAEAARRAARRRELRRR